MRCIGGIDVDAGAIQHFERLVNARGTVMDLFSREQYRNFHGREPGEDWREATVEDVRRAFDHEFPNVVAFSAPCKGFSALLSGKRSKSKKYQALNALTLRGVMLMLEAWADNLPELILFENVPNIQTRGRWLLDEIKSLLELVGYAVRETVHDCGELGGLAQHRTRFLLVARYKPKVGPFLYEPPRLPLQTIGQVVSHLPVPGFHDRVPMHRVSSLQWKTWVRLALIEAGKDWRSLEKLRIVDGYLADIGIVPDGPTWHHGVLGVQGFEDRAVTVTGGSRATQGRFSVADPMIRGQVSTRTGRKNEYRQYGVVSMEDVSPAVIGRAAAGSGAYSVADPRYEQGLGQHSGKMHVDVWEEQTKTVTGSDRVGSGARCVADPRLDCDATDKQKRRFNNVYRVVHWEEQSQAVTAGMSPSSGGQAVADPRFMWGRGKTAFKTGGHYGVRAWDEQSGAVVSYSKHDRGYFSVADPRELPEPDERCSPLIISLDGTWHRPFTTLELAVLQSFPVDMVLDGTKKQRREWIGNAVPPRTAKVIGDEMAMTLLLAWAGEAATLSTRPVWVSPLAMALSVADVDEL